MLRRIIRRNDKTPERSSGVESLSKNSLRLAEFAAHYSRQTNQTCAQQG
jgi:hypothetical protein